MTDDIDPRFLAIIKSLEVKYDDEDRSWAEETELFEEIPARLRMSAVDRARLRWADQARRVEEENNKKLTWKGWRG